jgi:hypothetical protein
MEPILILGGTIIAVLVIRALWEVLLGGRGPLAR